MRKRLTAILLSLSLALGLAPQIPASAAENIEFYYEQDGVTRKGLKSIEIDPYTYYNVGDEDGGTVVDVTFLRNLVEDELLDKWSQLAEDIFRVNPKKAWFNKDNNRDFEEFFNNPNGSEKSRIDLSRDLSLTSADWTNHQYKRSGLQYTTSLADVRTAMSVEMDDLAVKDAKEDPNFFFTNDGVSVNALAKMRDDTEKQDVFYNIVSTYDEAGTAWNMINSFGIAFYGFDLTPISDENLEYITAAEGYKSLEEAQTAGAPGVSYNSNGKGDTSVGYTENISREEAQMAVTLTNSNTTTLHNSITNEKNYSFSETIGSETKFSIGEVVEESINLEFSAEQAFGEARTQEEGVEKTIENSVTQTIVVPAHTAVAVEQETGNSNITLEYDCPVAISYKVAIFSMNCDFNDGGGLLDGYNKGYFSTYFEGDGSSKQGTSANENLYQRAVVGQGISGYDRANGVTDAYVHAWGDDWTETSDFIDWNAVLKNKNTSEEVKDIATFATKVPMASAGAEMEATSSSINSKIQSIVPLYNLKKVQLTTGEKAYEMSVDDSFPLDGLHVEGVNADKVAYYGFDENDGHWVLTDAEGHELTSSETAEITEDKLTGRKTLTAKEAGTVYLKWMLNDGVKYTSKNDATVISSENFDTPLVDTAYIKIDIEEIPFAGTIDVNGSYEGTVNADPVNLNDVLDATVYDESGKEVVRPLKWEARQLNGITVEPGGDVTFAKEGTYQVRAVISDEVRSDWVNVYGGEKPFEGSVVLTGSYTGTVGAAADDLNTKLDVRVFDTDKKQVDRPVTWEASELNGIKVTEDGKVTFTKPGTYHVQARVSDTIKSGWYAIKAVNPDTTIAVTGVTLSGAEKLSVGESVALTAAVAPANATDQALTFTSSSADVIKVDNSGRVTALKPGRATVTVTAAGGKKASMQITVTEPVVLPQGKALQGRKVKLTWNKVKNADGYEVYGAVCSGDMKLQKVVKGKKLTLSKVSRKKLDKNKDYKFRIKAYRMIDGKKVYLTASEDIHVKMTENSRYGNAASVKVSKKKKTLSAGKTWRPKVTVKMKGKAKQMKHVQPVRYLSSDETIATVTRTGKITARTKGTCFIYACAVNGKTAKIKITVR